MASTSEFYGNDLLGNMTRDPTKLPIWRCSGTNPPFMCYGTAVWQYSSNSNFWGQIGRQGSYTNSATADTWLTVLNLTSLTNPVIMGTYIGRYPNATATHKVRITVDGDEYTIEPAKTWNGRFVLGGLNNDMDGTTPGQTGGGMRFRHHWNYGDNNETYSDGYAFVEDPMDMLTHGMPLLYAKDSLKVEAYDSVIYNSGYHPYMGVTWKTLQGF